MEAILSVLPLCNELVIAVGKSDDDTLNFIKSIDSPKIKIINTIWDENLRKGGEVLASETNKALAAVDSNADWCIYIQGDECFHEKDYPNILSAMQQWKNEKNVEGLLFKYYHFYGSYDFVADSRRWYRNEIRIIKNNIGVKSWKDAQGFRIDGRKLKVKQVDASVYHYGWVRQPKNMMLKNAEAGKLWHSDEYLNKKFDINNAFDYTEIDSVKRFESTHPAVMQKKIESKNWIFDRDPNVKNYNLKYRILHFIEKKTGWRIGENKNYILI